MRKIILLLSIILFISPFYLPQPVYAHFPATDRGITAILHVDPNDSPIPGAQANLYFLLTYSSLKKSFYLNQCDCVIIVTEEGKQIFQQQLIEKNNPKNSIWGANVPFIFPSRDVYHIALSGKPNPGYSFQPFTVSWNFRVDEYQAISAPALQVRSLHQQSDPSFIYFVIGFFGIILCTGLILFLIIHSNRNIVDIKKNN